MKYNLLQMTQRILESMKSDEVNSITDTTEALQVANIIKECYFDLVGELGLKTNKSIFHLDASTDDTKPTVMSLPENALSIDILKYNVGDDTFDTNFREIDYLEPQEFLEYMNGLDVNADWVLSQNVTLSTGDFEIKYRNDQSPNYYTSLENTLVFDSFDSSYEDTLTSVRTYCIGEVVKTFSMSDTFVPDLDAKHFQLLLQSAKTQAFVEIKQTTNPKAEQKERRNRLLAQKTHDSKTDNRSNLEIHNLHLGRGRR